MKRFENKNFILVIISVMLFLNTYYVIMPVVPLHLKSMGVNNFTIGLIVGIFSAVSLIFRPLSGKVCDRVKPLAILRGSMLVFFLTPFFWLNPTKASIGIALCIYGVSVGAFSTASGLVVSDSVPKKDMGSAVGLYSIAIILAKGLGPTIGSTMYEAYGLFSTLAITFVFGIVSLVCTLFLKVEKRDRQVLQKDESESFFKVFAKRSVWLPSVLLMCITITFGAINAMLPLFAKARQIGQYSLFFTVNTAMVVLVRVAVDRFPMSIKAKIISSFSALVIGMLLIALCSNLSMLLLAAVFYGYGYGLSYPALTTHVILENDGSSRGTAYGVYSAFFDVGTMLGSAISGLSQYVGYTLVYQGVSMVPVIGILLYSFFSRRQRRQ